MGMRARAMAKVALPRLSARWSTSSHQAVGLASLLVDLRITQIVNGVRGVHAVLPHSASAEAGLVERSTEDR